jgi:V/A-type H+-transporting ATPase subunit I
MIVPMIKYDIILHHRDVDDFIQQLMQIGLVQILAAPSEEDAVTRELYAKIHETEEAITRCTKRIQAAQDVQLHHAWPTYSEFVQLEKDLEIAENTAEAVGLEIKLLEPWGDFTRSSLQELESATKREIKFFEYPERHFNPEWEKMYHLQIVNRIDGKLYFIIIKNPDQQLPISPIALPDATLSELIEQRHAAIEKIAAIHETLNQSAGSMRQSLTMVLADTKDQLSEHLAHLSTTNVAESHIWHIAAWCPLTAEATVQQFLTDTQTVFMRSLPTEEETPPVLLKNNRFTTLFEPIGTLFSLPNYHELDLTVFFAPFFLLFFGLCQGDAGYGILILALASMAKLKGNESNRAYGTLGQLFGVSTIVAGLLSGTFFGLEMMTWSLPDQVRSLFLQQHELFNLSLMIGFCQILFGMAVQAYKQWTFRGWMFAVSRLCWILLLLSLADLYAVKALPEISKYVLYLSLAGIVFFGAPEKGWLRSIGSGVADLYNITGILGDLLSYIRLFALGVASSILGLVINSIALSVKDDDFIGFILFLLVLVLGHGINFLLSTLSAFVHPMRLTFVEFYKNTGFIGGGRPFKPFSKHSIQSNQTL